MEWKGNFFCNCAGTGVSVGISTSKDFYLFIFFLKRRNSAFLLLYDALQSEVKGHLNSFLLCLSLTHIHIHIGIKMMEGGVRSNVRALQSSSHGGCTKAMCVLSNPPHCQHAMLKYPGWLHWDLKLPELDADSTYFSRYVSHSVHNKYFEFNTDPLIYLTKQMIYHKIQIL